MSIFTRLDDWYNTLSGLGTALDRSSYSGYQRVTPLSFSAAAALYDGDWLAARAVDIYPDEALAHDPVFTDEDAADAWRRLDRTEQAPKGVLRQGLIWGRVYGGAAILLGSPRAVDTSQPLRDSERVEWLAVLGRDELVPVQESLQRDPNQTDFGLADVFAIQASAQRPRSISYAGARVHRSRLVFCEGVECLDWSSITEWQEGFPVWKSVLDRIRQELAAYGLSWRSISAMLDESALSVLKVGGLREMIATQTKSEMDARFRALREGRSILRTMLLDADANEEYRRDVLSFGGVADVAQQCALKISAVLGVPPMVLFGQAPGGLNASGADVLTMWYSRVEQYRTTSVAPKIERILRAAGISDPGVSFPSMTEPTDSERHAVYEQAIRVGQMMIDAGLIDARVLREMLLAGDGQISFGPLADAEVETPEPESPAASEEAPEEQAAPDGSTQIQFAPTDIARVLTVNEFRERLGFGPIDGGDLTVEEFSATRAAAAEVVGVAEGEQEIGNAAQNPVSSRTVSENTDVDGARPAPDSDDLPPRT